MSNDESNSMADLRQEAEDLSVVISGAGDYALGNVTVSGYGTAGFIAINLASGRPLSVTIAEVSV